MYIVLFYINFMLHFHSKTSPIDHGNDSNSDFCHFQGEEEDVAPNHCARYLDVLGCDARDYDCVRPLAADPRSPSSFPFSIDCSIASHPRPTSHPPHKATRRPWEIREMIE
mmetsp:Transcript_38841/g.93899  ORF Transcript_38841/g.93899 Transcript_38841/m.93899 type:complete len:111 (+) Transcript_38841:279-611(+)